MSLDLNAGTFLALRRGDHERVCRDLDEIAWQQTYGLVAPGHEREDLVQAARIGISEAVRTWKPGPVPLPAFAAICAHRRALDFLTASRRLHTLPLSESVRFERPGLEGDGVFGDTLPDPRQDVPTLVETKERLREVLERFELLTRLERRAVMGTAFCGLQHDAIGNPKTIDNALQRARRKLRQEAIA